jgi:hypothetical protein
MYSTTTPEIYQKSFPANFTYQSSSLPETKELKDASQGKDYVTFNP